MEEENDPPPNKPENGAISKGTPSKKESPLKMDNSNRVRSSIRSRSSKEENDPPPNKPENGATEGAPSKKESPLKMNNSNRVRSSIRSRSSKESNRSSIQLMSKAFGHTVSDHIIAGPHGALQQTGAQNGNEDRLSFSSIQMTRRVAGVSVDEPVDFETAILETGHGCFQYKLMFLCGMVYACCSLSTTTLSFVLPAAQYEFKLDSVSKGVLNTAPLWGMIVGAYVWGNFADSKGRRFVLMWALTIDSIAAFVSSFCPVYLAFYIVRMFNGFGIIGATSIVFAYMGEFLDHSYRDRYLARLEIAWTVGIIALPCIGLAILPHTFVIGSEDGFLYTSWRAFVFACGVPSMLAVILIYRMPESPRFLLLQGKLEETREVLERMYVSNTGKPKDSFSVKFLNASPESEHYHFSTTEERVSCFGRMKNVIVAVFKQHRQLFQGRSFFNILITCYIDFGLICVYYTMTLWVPELLNRQKNYADLNPNSQPTLCEVVGQVAQSEPEKYIKMGTFVYTIVTCLACMPTTLLLLCLISYVSKKGLLVGIMVSAAIPAIGIAHINSIFQAVTMLSLLKSLTNLAEAILFCAIVEIFPINTRGTALSLTVTVGRIGSVVGNVVFGLMIDHHCNWLFYGMGANLVLSGMASILLPKMKSGH